MVEEGIRAEGANSEITSNIVLQAVRKNKNFTRKRPNIQLVIIKIIFEYPQTTGQWKLNFISTD